jgi:hypothetical protein
LVKNLLRIVGITACDTRPVDYKQRVGTGLRQFKIEVFNEVDEIMGLFQSIVEFFNRGSLHGKKMKAREKE